jgi:hypothetical protein
MPVILVIFDAQNDRAYWLNVQNYADSIKPKDVDGVDNEKERATITVHIPTTNRLNVRAIQKLREFKEAILARVKGVAGYDK